MISQSSASLAKRFEITAPVWQRYPAASSSMAAPASWGEGFFSSRAAASTTGPSSRHRLAKKPRDTWGTVVNRLR